MDITQPRQKQKQSRFRELRGTLKSGNVPGDLRRRPRSNEFSKPTSLSSTAPLPFPKPRSDHESSSYGQDKLGLARAERMGQARRHPTTHRSLPPPSSLLPPPSSIKCPSFLGSMHRRSSEGSIRPRIPTTATMQRLGCAITAFLFLAGLAGETFAQSATSPAPAGPTNITAILEKAGQYGTLIRLLRSTQVGDQMNNELNNSNTGLTIFAPTDNAFSSLPAGTLNSLSDQQKVALIQFHVLPTLVSASQFQTVSNPVRTQAGDASNGRYPLNVTTMGTQVNLSTGVVDATIANTVYSDSKLAVYQVDQVLLPLEIFGPPAPAAAPAPAEAKKQKPSPVAEGPSTPSTDATDASAAVNLSRSASGGGITFAATALWLWWSF
ncbi:hypothetical protein BHE74_00002547 [Ensete ventricosum]|nr:hypothetical protein BHE74_00002547 [Ensete ventricosum]